MHASFAFGRHGGPVLDEVAAETALSALHNPAEDGALMGHVLLSAEGAEPVAIRDDLQFLVPDLCLRAPAALAMRDRVELSMAALPKTYLLLREAGTVRILDAGTGTELGHYPEAALFEALRGCASRFTRYVGALARIASEWQPLHRMLEQELTGAGHR